MLSAVVTNLSRPITLISMYNFVPQYWKAKRIEWKIRKTRRKIAKRLNGGAYSEWIAS